MGATEEEILSLADTFHNAALQGDGWYDALDRLAKATGSQTGELIGVGAKAAVPFNLVTEVGGVNPRVGAGIAGMKAPILKVLSEEDFLTWEEEEYDCNPHYQEFAIPWDIPHICLTTLDRNNEMLVVLAVVRTRRDGPITPEQKALFAAVAPHVRAAVRTQMARESQGVGLLGRVFEGLSLATFICDRHGKVRTLTPAAEVLVEKTGPLQLRSGVLNAVGRENAAVLADAIHEASFGIVYPGRPQARTIVLRDADPSQPLLLDVIRLLRPVHELAFSPHIVIVARTGRASDAAQRTSILQAAFGLTAAEADIAARIAQGETTAEIAEARGATIGTVRMQLKAAMAKLGVRRQAEVAAKLSPL